MKKIVVICDVCNSETIDKEELYQVIAQDAEYSCPIAYNLSKKYLSHKKFHLCDKCKAKVLDGHILYQYNYIGGDSTLLFNVKEFFFILAEEGIK
jgi:hypothetical protein